jgi:hypothetical protein
MLDYKRKRQVEIVPYGEGTVDEFYLPPSCCEEGKIRGNQMENTFRWILP